MAIQPTQPQSIGGVLDTSFQLYKAAIGSVWPICLILSVGATLPSIYLLTKGGFAPNPADPMAGLAIFKDPMYWLTYAVSMAVSMWAMGALYFKAHAVGTDTEVSVGAALQASLGRVFTLFLMTILVMIAIMLGMVLLVIPGLILMVSLMLAWNLAIFEDKGPISSLTGSHRLVWGNWWRTAVILTIGFVIVMVIYFAVALVIGIVMPLLALGGADVFTYSLITGVVVGLLINLLVTPFFIFMLVAIYWDLKLRKEGGDLAARVGALGTA